MIKRLLLTLVWLYCANWALALILGTTAAVMSGQYNDIPGWYATWILVNLLILAGVFIVWIIGMGILALISIWKD